MKTRVFVLKFVDHDNKQIMEISIIVHSTKVSEWSMNENDMESMIQWKAKHFKWEHILKKEIKKIVKNHYFNGSNEFNGYTFVKEMYKHEGEKVNMSDKPSEGMYLGEKISNLVFRQVKHMELLVMKFNKGKKDQNWKEMYNYPVANYVHNFLLNSDENNDNIQLSELTAPFVLKQDQFNGENTPYGFGTNPSGMSGTENMSYVFGTNPQYMSGMNAQYMSGMNPQSMSGMNPQSMSAMNPQSMSATNPQSMSGMNPQYTLGTEGISGMSNVPATPGMSNQSGTDLSNQRGGNDDNDDEKNYRKLYIKYKNKYMNARYGK